MGLNISKAGVRRNGETPWGKATSKEATSWSGRRRHGGLQVNRMAITWNHESPANLLVHKHSGDKRLCFCMKIAMPRLCGGLSRKVELSGRKPVFQLTEERSPVENTSSTPSNIQGQVAAGLRASGAGLSRSGRKTAQQDCLCVTMMTERGEGNKSDGTDDSVDNKGGERRVPSGLV